ncbi:MAG: Fic family protein [Cyclobacteriaceae bacterium]
MIVSFDTIMKPPYEVTSSILKMVSTISEKMGTINAYHLSKPPTELRKKNKIKTIQSSLEIEGNTLTVEQITAILNDKRIIAPAKDILEVKNAIKIYDRIGALNPHSIRDFKTAHKTLMNGLLENPGDFRVSEVGIVKGTAVQHLAPPGRMVNGLMNNLFKYLKGSDELPLIKSCVFHYELEFIHPFIDGNGRMGRLWQSVILIKDSPIFEFLPIEIIIKQQQKEYYEALSQSDKTGKATYFIEFMLSVINEALEVVVNGQRPTLTNKDRLLIFRDFIGGQIFSRQDYLVHFKEISSATASRDLKYGVDQNILTKHGDKRLTEYQYN